MSLLTLTMIVKNEAPTIARTLESVREYIDYWVILDTGSHDATPGIVREVLSEVPGTFYHVPFVDYSFTRNAGLDLCGTDSDFILWLDADDVVENPAALRAALEDERNATGPDREAYYLSVRMGGVVFDQARVLRSRAGWRFQGAVHEVLTCPGKPPPSLRIPGVTVQHTQASPERSRARWEKDVELLRKAIAKDPTDTRAQFYLGLTYAWLGQEQEAVCALSHRARMGGWKEEVFYAKLAEARAMRRAGYAWHEVLGNYLEAYEVAPHRAEPLFDIATHYSSMGDHAAAKLFYEAAAKIPFPHGDSLFVEEGAYTK